MFFFFFFPLPLRFCRHERKRYMVTHTGPEECHDFSSCNTFLLGFLPVSDQQPNLLRLHSPRKGFHTSDNADFTLPFLPFRQREADPNASIFCCPVPCPWYRVSCRAAPKRRQPRPPSHQRFTFHSRGCWCNLTLPLPHE